MTQKVQEESSQGVDFVPLADLSGISLEFGGVRRERRISFSRIDPVITSHGLGSNSFRWHFTNHAAAPLYASNRRAAAVLRLPRAVEEFHGTLTCQATVRRRVVGILRDHEAGDGPRPFTFRPLDASFTLAVEHTSAS